MAERGEDALRPLPHRLAGSAQQRRCRSRQSMACFRDEQRIMERYDRHIPELRVSLGISDRIRRFGMVSDGSSTILYDGGFSNRGRFLYDHHRYGQSHIERTFRLQSDFRTSFRVPLSRTRPFGSLRSGVIAGFRGSLPITARTGVRNGETGQNPLPARMRTDRRRDAQTAITSEHSESAIFSRRMADTPPGSPGSGLSSQRIRSVA